jgi:hypothetical protein
LFKQSIEARLLVSGTWQLNFSSCNYFAGTNSLLNLGKEFWVEGIINFPPYKIKISVFGEEDSVEDNSVTIAEVDDMNLVDDPSDEEST